MKGKCLSKNTLGRRWGHIGKAKGRTSQSTVHIEHCKNLKKVMYIE